MTCLPYSADALIGELKIGIDYHSLIDHSKNAFTHCTPILAGVRVVSLAILLHAVFPRYEIQPVPNSPTFVLRTDRWTGRIERILVPSRSPGLGDPSVDDSKSPVHRNVALRLRVWLCGSPSAVAGRCTDSYRFAFGIADDSSTPFCVCW